MTELSCLAFTVVLPFVVGYLNQLAIGARYAKEHDNG